MYVLNSLATPTNDSSLETAANGTAPRGSPNDHIYQNLDAAGKLNWTNVNGGHVTTVSREDWDAADNQGWSSKRSGSPHELKSRPRRGAITGGDVQGLVTSLVCYHRGSLAQDSMITAYVTQACDALLGAAVPAPALKALQIWQSPSFGDANGINAYLRFSYELLTANTNNAPPSLCEQALGSFQNYCQDGMCLDVDHPHDIQLKVHR